MARRLTREEIVTLQSMAARGMGKAEIARALDVTEGAVRYHLKKASAGPKPDGRIKQRRLAELWPAVEAWREAQDGRGVNLAALHDWLVREHGYEGSLRSVQRAWRDRFGAPKIRARRRVETPPGAQAQVDWAHFPRMVVGRRAVDLLAFHMLLSHSRKDAIVWAERKDTLNWLACHNEAFRRLGGIAASCRVDNEKTAVARGAGSWGTLNPAYKSYALQCKFHIDVCRPRTPEAKGKVERRIRTQRGAEDPRKRAWASVKELQEWTDEMTTRSAERMTCPATGTSVAEAWRSEKRVLTPTDNLPEPFDSEVTRRVGVDCLVAFDKRRYSVPFEYVGRHVAVRGCAREIHILCEDVVIARHPRNTVELLVIDQAHFDGDDTARVQAPVPLGRVGRVLDEIAREKPQARSIEIYAALAEATR